MDNENSQKEHQEEFTAMMKYLFLQFSLGKTNDQVVSDLIDKGMKQDEAQSIVETVRKIYAPYPNEAVNLHRYAVAQRGWKRMWTGFFWLALGSCITWVTYSAAASSPYGGRYTICYGAIALGGIYFLWGLFEWLGNR